MNKILHSTNKPMSFLFHTAPLDVCVCHCMCVGMWVWSRHLNMGRSSLIQPHQVSHHSHQHNKKHFTIWCFQSTIRDNIFYWQQNCLDARARAGGWGCGYVSGCVRFCAWMCVFVCLVAVGSSCLCSGLVCCQACALMMRVQFLRYSLFAVCHENHKSATA